MSSETHRAVILGATEDFPAATFSPWPDARRPDTPPVSVSTEALLDRLLELLAASARIEADIRRLIDGRTEALARLARIEARLAQLQEQGVTAEQRNARVRRDAAEALKKFREEDY